MKYKGLIEGKKIESPYPYVVHSDEMGIVAECEDLQSAKQALEKEEAQCKERRVEPHFGIFQWSGKEWKPAISLYELQEAGLKKNPTGIVRFP